MTVPSELLEQAAQRAQRYLDGLAHRRVAPDKDALAKLRELGGPLPEGPTDASEALALLDEAGSPATVATAGGRFFGFVIGGSLPAALATRWLSDAWDQNAYSTASSPTAAAVEEIALGWVREALGLPREWGGGFVTGGTMGNFTCLAAARSRLLANAGWDVERRGLYGAPELRVVVGEEAHPSIDLALGYLGLGRERVERVPVDDQGRMRADALPDLDARTLVCLQAGNVNTGAFDPIADVVAKTRAAGAWLHVDGAFGLWAAASAARRHLASGIELADSASVDAHKWLNVPYDCGIALTRHPEAMRDAMAAHAAYLVTGEGREPNQYAPEMSRRARGVEVWAALRTLGRAGLAQLVERNCAQANRFSQGLRDAGYEVLNDVVLNQVLVSFGDPERTRRVIARIQEDGTCWCGGTEWQGRTAMRISVSSWRTTDDDVERSLDAILRAAREA